MQIIGISGKAKAGKDLLFSSMQEDGWVKASFAAELKARVRRDFNLTEEHTDGVLKDVKLERLNWFSPRELMIDYGTGLFRKYDSNYWVSRAFNLGDGKFAFTDVRFPNEADAIKKNGGRLIRLERHASRDQMVSAETRLSQSETALDSYKHFDFVLPAELNATPEHLAQFWAVVRTQLS